MPLFSPSYQDLSSERARSQELFTQVQHLSKKLQKAEAELKTATDSLNQSQEKIESLSKRLKKSESLLQLEKSRGTVEVDATSNSSSDSLNKVHICQTHTQEMSQLDQRPEAGKDFFATHENASGEAERQLRERLIELEKEVCVSSSIYCGIMSLWISFTGCLCGSTQFLCDGDGLYYVEILPQGMLHDYQLRVGCLVPEYSTLFPEVLLYLCWSVFIMTPRPL